MERQEAIDHLIEVAREEAPQVVAERTREAVEALEAGIAAVVASARERVRPEPRRPDIVRVLAVAVVVAALCAAIGLMLRPLVQRGRDWLRQRRAGAGFGPRRAAPDLSWEADEDRDDAHAEVSASMPRVAIPVEPELASSDGARLAADHTQRVATS